MKLFRLILFLAALANVHAATVVGTNYGIGGSGFTADMTIVSASNPSVLTNGMGVQKQIKVTPNSDGSYSVPLTAGGYDIFVGPFKWSFSVPNTNATFRMVDLIASGATIYNYSNFAAVYGVKVSSSDTTPNFLSNKVVSSSTVAVTVTNVGGNEQIYLTSFSAGSGVAVTAGTNVTAQTNLGVVTINAVVSHAEVTAATNGLNTAVMAAINSATNGMDAAALNRGTMSPARLSLNTKQFDNSATTLSLTNGALTTNLTSSGNLTGGNIIGTNSLIIKSAGQTLFSVNSGGFAFSTPLSQGPVFTFGNNTGPSSALSYGDVSGLHLNALNWSGVLNVGTNGTMSTSESFGVDCFEFTNNSGNQAAIVLNAPFSQNANYLFESVGSTIASGAAFPFRPGNSHDNGVAVAGVGLTVKYSAGSGSTSFISPVGFTTVLCSDITDESVFDSEGVMANVFVVSGDAFTDFYTPASGSVSGRRITIFNNQTVSLSVGAFEHGDTFINLAGSDVCHILAHGLVVMVSDPSDFGWIVESAVPASSLTVP